MDKDFALRHRNLETLLRAAVALDLPLPYRPLSTGRPAAVMMLCGLRENGSFEVLITRRSNTLETHRGQYALPGGMRDAESETPERNALRETREEVGIPEDGVIAIGALPELWTPTGFTVTPVVGLLRSPIEEVEIRPSPDEIDLWFWCSVDRFRATGVYSTEPRTFVHEGKSRTVPMDVYQVDEHRIWGATGAMLRNFISRLEKVESSR